MDTNEPDRIRKRKIIYIMLMLGAAILSVSLLLWALWPEKPVIFRQVELTSSALRPKTTQAALHAVQTEVKADAAGEAESGKPAESTLPAVQSAPAGANAEEAVPKQAAETADQAAREDALSVARGKDRSDGAPAYETQQTAVLTSLGEYKITFYCKCVKCCGKDDGITATGTIATANRTVAVNPQVIAYGSKVVIAGREYIAEDTGGFKGKVIDVYVDSHQEALNLGVMYEEVFVQRSR